MIGSEDAREDLTDWHLATDSREKESGEGRDRERGVASQRLVSDRAVIHNLSHYNNYKLYWSVSATCVSMSMFLSKLPEALCSVFFSVSC